MFSQPMSACPFLSLAHSLFTALHCCGANTEEREENRGSEYCACRLVASGSELFADTPGPALTWKVRCCC
ncbi:hypothetical protein GDO81_010539 [Engystomops pustulosus]|uniref:Secreted protein n=1 Tax=Engystomops pustulosus TaxID=76066 RepID=A0AAV7C0S4_ENGPU|nr:hypothetical protein GDO81_010539 [Engystomops pustulosus]